MCQIRIVWLLVCYTWLLLSVGVTVSADDVDYLRDVKPVLRERCFACHGSLKQEAELRLDTVDAMRHGSYSGSVLDANNVDASMLWQRITATDEERMPPEGAALSAEEIQAIRTWMIQGAVGPIDEQPEADPTQHWAFLPPVASPIPNTKASATNPIDAFLNDKLVSAGIAPNPAADPSLQLRRLSIDLIGLVPNQSEQQAFLAAYTESPEQAYADAVQQLLHRPEHGQRWARHWMDIWRYSDWYGLGEQVRFSQKHIWRWRSWIVESLNQNVGYDQMILQMLAADEIWPTDESKLRATGFLVRNYYLFNRTTWLDNTIEHTAKALMGLTMNCCKCHDHKYDPLSYEDYYRMRAIFEPHQVRIDLVESQTNLDVDGLVRTFDAHPDEPTYVHLRGNEKDLDTSRVVPPGVPAVVADLPYSPEEITLPPAAFAPQIRPDVLAAYEAESQGRIDAATKTLEAFSEIEEASAITSAERVVAERELAAAQRHLEKVRTAHAADVAKVLEVTASDACRKNAILAKRQATLADARLALAKLEFASLSDDQEKRPSTEQLENAQTQVDHA
ncbi:MAG: DUF1549 domain-containing protein, partial [Planctomycetales bacterium]|nr:DUF1549 domain-containing protein [Planctomycetales bacterium]